MFNNVPTLYSGFRRTLLLLQQNIFVIIPALTGKFKFQIFTAFYSFLY